MIWGKRFAAALVAATLTTACAPIGNQGSPATTPWTKPSRTTGAPNWGSSTSTYTTTTTTTEAGPTTNGSLLVPKDIEPGNYWAVPTGSYGGYVEVCSDYSCQVGAGMIENYTVSGRTMVPIPGTAKMVNVEYVTLTPVQ